MHRRTDAPTHRWGGGHGGTGARGHGWAGAWTVAILAPLVLWAQPAVAQLGVSAAGLVSQVEHRVNAGRGVEQSSGIAYGGVGKLGIGPVEIWLTGMSGKLTADSASADDRDLAEAEVQASVLAVPWLALQVGVSARSYATQFSRQRWIATRLGGELRLDFVGGSLRGLIRGAFLPTVSVSGLERPNRAIAAAAGIEWRRGILTAGVAYALERYDFPLVGTVKRHEQLARLTAQLGLSLGGGW